MSKAYVYDKQNYKTLKISSWFTLNNEVSQFFDCLANKELFTQL